MPIDKQEANRMPNRETKQDVVPRHDAHLNILLRSEKLYTGQEIIRLYKDGTRDFSFINAEGADLSDADLPEINFEGANLRRMKGENTNFQGANFTNANLEDSNLYLANFNGANLRSAIMKNSNLNLANLFGANIDLIDLEGAEGIYD